MTEVDETLDLDDDTGGGDGSQARDEHDELTCPVCGNSFSSRNSLGRHMLKQHQQILPRKQRESKQHTDESPRRKTGTRRPGRQAKIAQTIVRVVDLYEQRDGSVEGIAATLRKDATKIAGFVAGVADYFSPLGLLVDKTMGDGGLLDGALSFAGVFRALQARLRGRNAEQQRIQQVYEERYATLLEREGQEVADEYARRVQAGEVAVE